MSPRGLGRYLSDGGEDDLIGLVRAALADEDAGVGETSDAGGQPPTETDRDHVAVGGRDTPPDGGRAGTDGYRGEGGFRFGAPLDPSRAPAPDGPETQTRDGVADSATSGGSEQDRSGEPGATDRETHAPAGRVAGDEADPIAATDRGAAGDRDEGGQDTTSERPADAGGPTAGRDEAGDEPQPGTTERPDRRAPDDEEPGEIDAATATDAGGTADGTEMESGVSAEMAATSEMDEAAAVDAAETASEEARESGTIDGETAADAGGIAEGARRASDVTEDGTGVDPGGGETETGTESRPSEDDGDGRRSWLGAGPPGAESADVEALLARDGTGILVQCDAGDDARHAACTDLLGLDIENRNVLLIRYERLDEPRLERIATSARRVTVVSVAHAQPVPESLRNTVETVEIATANDLTRLGIVVTRTLRDWESTPGRPAVCFDSLTVTLRYKAADDVFRFVHLLLNQLYAADATAHFHVDPGATTQQEVGTLKPLFDDVLRVAGD